jgi:hypothetical protein
MEAARRKSNSLRLTARPETHLTKLPALILAFGCTGTAQQPVLWQNPGTVEYRDLAGGPAGRAGAPRGPFRFIQSDDTGTSPKVVVRDLNGKRWSVKWGPEVMAENFASRMAWAVGYYVEPVYYVRSGRIRGSSHPGRARKFIGKNGAFRDARFETRSNAGRFLRQYDWTWKKNPFVGTRELNGLKILLMLTSNWDNKDARDNGSNTGILESGAGRRLQWTYLVTDWGASMGKWGNFFTREKWDCGGFRKQTPDFVDRVEDGVVKFGFSGQHDDDFKEGIRTSDVRWIMQYLGHVTDAQIKRALRASGASGHEVDCFTVSMRSRISQLKRVAGMGVRGS